MIKKIKYYLPLIIIILIFYWLADISQENNIKISQTTDIQFLKQISGKFIAIDGDSLKIKNGAEIRLLGIDAPEYKQICFDKNNNSYDCGKISGKFLRKLTYNKNLICKYNKKDIYNRYLAICFDGNLNINQEMLRNGMAIIYNIYNASEEIKSIEKQARIDKIGIWQGKFLAPKDFRKLKK